MSDHLRTELPGATFSPTFSPHGRDGPAGGHLVELGVSAAAETIANGDLREHTWVFTHALVLVARHEGAANAG